MKTDIRYYVYQLGNPIYVGIILNNLFYENDIKLNKGISEGQVLPDGAFKYFTGISNGIIRDNQLIREDGEVFELKEET